MSNFVRIKTNGGTIEINPLQISSIIVREIPKPKGFVVNINIMPGKALYLETEGKVVFETKAAAEAAKDLLITELNLGQVDNEIFEVVSVLPTTGVENKIYLVPSSDPKTQNELDEFIWVDNAWEKIGAVSVDLSNYFNKTEINSLLGNKVDKNAAITAGTHPKITYDAKGLVTGGGALDADDIPNLAPTKITQNASNRFVTDVEKAYWNGKQDKLVAGENITINPTTNEISASEVYSKTEIDTMIGNIDAILDSILGV